MSYLDRAYLPGDLALWCAMVLILAALWGYAQTLRGDEEARRFARMAYSCFALAVVGASAVLLFLLIGRDFRIEYVFQYSRQDLPWHLQVAAFWAGQKGSFLTWLLCGSILGLPLMLKAGREEAAVMGTYCLTLLGLLFILVRESPFVMLPRTPSDGTGLNPLLHDSWMVIHPPLVFLGYAAAAVPFSFATAALWRRRYSRWADLSFPWALGGFLALGAAILTGGHWAYRTPGWGGYWSWDPVENASLIPWISSIGLVHGLYAERRGGRLRRATLALACLPYLSVLHGTFLTRSGILADSTVHGFVDTGVSGWLVGLTVFFLAVSAYLVATRLREIRPLPSANPPLSRGSILALAMIALTAAAGLIALGTSAPLLREFLPGQGQVEPELYNRMTLPIALVLCLLLAVVPHLTWEGAALGAVLGRLVAPGVLALAVSGLAAALGVRAPVHLLAVFLATLALGANLHRWVGASRSGGMRNAGGYLSHVGVAAVLLGVLASSAYDRSTRVTLEQGVAQRVDGIGLTFTRILPRQARGKQRMEIEAEMRDGRSYFAYPELSVDDRTRQIVAQPHIRRNALEDVYISPIQLDPGEPTGGGRRMELARGPAATLSVNVTRRPLVNLVWLGFYVVLVGAAMATFQGLREATPPEHADAKKLRRE